MFGLFSGRKKARESAMVTILNDLLLQFGGYVDFDPEKFVRIIKDDPYVGGYLSGKVTCDASIHMKNAGLHKDDFSEVTGAVLLGLFGTTYLQMFLLHAGNIPKLIPYSFKMATTKEPM